MKWRAFCSYALGRRIFGVLPMYCRVRKHISISAFVKLIIKRFTRDFSTKNMVSFTEL